MASEYVTVSEPGETCTAEIAVVAVAAKFACAVFASEYVESSVDDGCVSEFAAVPACR